MVLGNETVDDFGDANRHRYCVNQIAACVGKRLALSRIGSDSEQFIRRLGAGGAQIDP